MRFSYAPEGMGKEYVNQPRKPLSEYVGASVEFCAFPGAPDEPVAWDPMREDFRNFRMDRISRPEVIEGAAFRSRRVPFDAGVQPVRYA